jgi:hypothetical protein
LSNVTTCWALSSPFGHDYISLYKRRFVICGYSKHLIYNATVHLSGSYFWWQDTGRTWSSQAPGLAPAQGTLLQLRYLRRLFPAGSAAHSLPRHSASCLHPAPPLAPLCRARGKLARRAAPGAPRLDAYARSLPLSTGTGRYGRRIVPPQVKYKAH